MDKQRQERLLQVYSTGKVRYILEHGVIRWGILTAIIYRTLYAITTHGWSLKGIADEVLSFGTIGAIAIFGILGIAFGFFMWKWIEREVKKIPPKPDKEKKNKKKK
ncbi:hypothetical protein [Alkaliphilus transvaalensis]|uniref:hypothetical protein n=1 Tax=Alkaliphilus transvaalensis TaxID=114628 RepID=UPI00047A0FCC|nr:hypothetical protein [Alkaliphilus transvaalensis]